MSQLVSIIVPCYNQALYLDDALQSVMNQSYQEWECIIVDDGSPDNTEQIAKEWLAKDIRFKYINKKNGGICSARNLGITEADGEFILPLDADDKIGSDYLKLTINEFLKDPTLKVVYTKAEKFGSESGVWNLPVFDISKLGLYNMIFCSALYRKTEWERVGGYDLNMVLGLEDWEFWIAVLKNGGHVSQLDYVGFYYRIKEKSRHTNLDVSDKKELYNYLSIKHADFYVKHQGSFITLNSEIEALKKMKLLKGRKKVLNLFCKTFFGFYIFKHN
ncbi:glycosyltransferase family A protein [Mariniflexile litorale]|uniref:Glycosyltransferase family A protein n=1 Tax=Mariniflexile litorale TaxID=3045158 RepID=A0AAU7EDT1_9FLAO|nr:glycosyltransferase family A protein [Mariniflexile sp. KMM 9835]MDQ8212213.1 glycosyltransferase family A protein [Mariniflexile sp. KMM 9835]